MTIAAHLIAVTLLVTAQATAPERPAAKPSSIPARATKPSDPHSGRVAASWAALVNAVATSNRDAIANHARRVGIARLGAAMRRAAEDALAPETLDENLNGRAGAALRAMEFVDGPHRLIPSAALLLHHPDGNVVGQALQGLQHALTGADPRTHQRWELSAKLLARICSRSTQLAAERQYQAPLRLAALTLAASPELECDLDFDPFADDPDPAIRRGALLTTQPAHASLVSALTDSDPHVVATAAVRLCELAPNAKAETLQPSLDAALRFAAASGSPAADTVALLDCLARRNPTASQAVLQQAKGSTVKAIARRARRLLEP